MSTMNLLRHLSRLSQIQSTRLDQFATFYSLILLSGTNYGCSGCQCYSSSILTFTTSLNFAMAYSGTRNYNCLHVRA